MNSMMPGQGMPQQVSPEQQLIAIAQEMMTRADLKGREVDGYAKAFNFLQTIGTGEFMVIPRVSFDQLHTDINRYREMFGDLPEEEEVVEEEVEEEQVDEELPVLEPTDDELDAVKSEN